MMGVLEDEMMIEDEMGVLEDEKITVNELQPMIDYGIRTLSYGRRNPHRPENNQRTSKPQGHQ